MIAQSLQEFSCLMKIGSPLIGIDHGSKKLGFALSTPNLQMSLPLDVIIAETEEKKIDCILKLVFSYKVSGIVIGLPISMNGNENESSKKIRLFAQTLASQTDLPIYLQDERLSSRQADNILRSFGFNRKDRNKIDDKIAANFILETTLDTLIKLQVKYY